MESAGRPCAGPVPPESAPAGSPFRSIAATESVVWTALGRRVETAATATIRRTDDGGIPFAGMTVGLPSAGAVVSSVGSAVPSVVLLGAIGDPVERSGGTRTVGLIATRVVDRARTTGVELPATAAAVPTDRPAVANAGPADSRLCGRLLAVVRTAAVLGPAGTVATVVPAGFAGAIGLAGTAVLALPVGIAVVAGTGVVAVPVGTAVVAVPVGTAVLAVHVASTAAELRTCRRPSWYLAPPR